ncbi:hypothetical protein WJX74_010367 [Apatococcus lobatus]|uniref:Uncharacterized protein n=1 Tax=Apatococcus lobatus TaxID=904363 RepID=A0AAW1S2T8_9CHLO
MAVQLSRRSRLAGSVCQCSKCRNSPGSQASLADGRANFEPPERTHVELPPRQQAPRCTVTVSKALGQLQVHGREQEEGRSGTLAMSRQIPPAQSSKEQVAKGN